MRNYFFLFVFLFVMSFLFPGKVEAQKITGGACLNGYGSLSLNQMKNNGNADISFWGTLEIEFSKRISIMPIIDFGASYVEDENGDPVSYMAVGSLFLLNFREKGEKNLSFYLLAEKAIYYDLLGCELGVDFYRFNKGDPFDPSLFTGFGFEIENKIFFPYACLGLSLPLNFPKKE